MNLLCIASGLLNSFAGPAIEPLRPRREQSEIEIRYVMQDGLLSSAQERRMSKHFARSITDRAS